MVVENVREARGLRDLPAADARPGRNVAVRWAPFRLRGVCAIRSTASTAHTLTEALGGHVSCSVFWTQGKTARTKRTECWETSGGGGHTGRGGGPPTPTYEADKLAEDGRASVSTESPNRGCRAADGPLGFPPAIADGAAHAFMRGLALGGAQSRGRFPPASRSSLGWPTDGRTDGRSGGLGRERVPLSAGFKAERGGSSGASGSAFHVRGSRESRRLTYFSLTHPPRPPPLILPFPPLPCSGGGRRVRPGKPGRPWALAHGNGRVVGPPPGP